MNKVLITGITGQLGSYLADKYLAEGWEVFGIIRRSSVNTLERIEHLSGKINAYEGDITDFESMSSIITWYHPNLIINCAAQSHVATSFSQPKATFDSTYGGVYTLLSILKNRPEIKMIQLSSSEMFGNNYSLGNFIGKFQDENTPFNPRSPYAVAKLAAHHMCDIYRRFHGLYINMAICFNMESERRGENFVTRKITKYISELLTELDSYSWEVLNEEERAKCLPYITKLKLGNLKAYRDWTYCPDSADAIFRMGNHDFSTTPHKNWDFVISSGCTHTVEEFLHEAFTLVGLDWHKFVEIDSLLYRPCEVEYLRGDSTNIQKLLGWQVTTSFKDLVKIMVDSDCKKNTTKKF